MKKARKSNTVLNKLLVLAMILSCITLPSVKSTITVNAVTTPTGICKDTNAADYATKCSNEKELSSKVGTVSSPSGADYQSIWSRELSEFQWTDTSAMTNVDRWDGSIAANAPTIEADGFYSIGTAEELAYVVSNLKDGDKIRLTNNIDLMGYNHEWTYGGQGEKDLLIKYNQLKNDVVIDGSDYTIYNLGTIDNWFIRGLKHAEIKNLNFVSAKMYYSKIVPYTYMGIFGVLTCSNGLDIYDFNSPLLQVGDVKKMLAPDSATTITNVSVQKSIFYSNGDQNSSGSYISPLGHQVGVIANQVKTRNNSLYAQLAHIGGAFGRPDGVVIKNSFSLDSTIVAKGNHSGGFISCTNGELTVENSFTNNEVYAEKSTGVFIGAIIADRFTPNTSFKNCYASGTLEGTTDLGGFIGMVEQNGEAKVSFENCYSTSIVGMENGGTKLGGFIGSMVNTSDYTFKNCYAAGEVGHISTNIDIKDPNHSGSNSVGGFGGDMGNPSIIVVNNVYYDKQTTGMREWQTGNSMDSATNLIAGADQTSIGFEGYNNTDFKEKIRGVLTSDSEKSGHGLASLPDPDSDRLAGFVGFENPGEWVYDGGNTDTANHNCLYPQLSVFEKPKEDVWGSEDVVNLVAASSYASVSTVHENVWEKGEKNQLLSTTTYDTVRELTTRFTMTSYITSSLADKDIDIDWKKTDAPVNLYGEDIKVIGSLTNSNSPKYNRPYITADKFAPGIEWLTVTVNVNGQLGSRRIRIIPTMNIEPGDDNLSLNDNETYNHAKDVKFAFSTGVRMSQSIDDITRALYPDKYNPNAVNGELFGKEDPRNAFVKKYTDENKLSPMNSFNHQDDDYIVDSKYITKNDSSADLKYDATEDTDYIHVRLFKINNVTPIDDPNNNNLGTSGKLELNRTKDLLGDSNSDWLDKLNGNSPLEIKDEGKYVVEYSCTLPDGRYLRDSKLLVIRKEKYDVSMQVLDYKDNTYDTSSQNSTLNNDVFALKADKYHSVNTILNESYTDKSGTFSISNGVSIGTPIYMAGKKLNSDYSVNAIKLEVESFGGTQSQVFGKIEVGQNTELAFLYDHYYDSYEVNGEYFVRIKRITKKYSIVYDNTNGNELYYAVMNFDSYSPEYQDLKDAGINIKDIDVDVKASIFVVNNNPTTGTLKIIKNTVDETDQPFATDEKFALNITDSNSFQLGLLLSSATENTTNEYTVSLDAGSYVFDEVVPMRYQLTNIKVKNHDGTINEDLANKEFEIVAGKETILNLTNKKVNNSGGTHYVTNTLKVAE